MYIFMMRVKCGIVFKYQKPNLQSRNILQHKKRINNPCFQFKYKLYLVVFEEFKYVLMLHMIKHKTLLYSKGTSVIWNLTFLSNNKTALTQSVNVANILLVNYVNFYTNFLLFTFFCLFFIVDLIID